MQRKKESHYQSNAKRRKKKEIIEIVFWIILCAVFFILLGYIKQSIAEESAIFSSLLASRSCPNMLRALGIYV